MKVLNICNTLGYTYNLACPSDKNLFINTYIQEFILKNNGDLNCETATDYKITKPTYELERGCFYRNYDKSNCFFAQEFITGLFNVTNIPEIYYPIPKRIVAEFTCLSN